MQATILAADLKAALTSINRAVSKRSTLPIMANVHITIGLDHVTLYATDLETAVQVDIPAETDDLGSFTMPARRTLDFVKSADKDDSIIVALLEGNPATGTGYSVALRHGRASITLPVIPAEEYPIVQELGPVIADIDGPAFLAAIKRALVFSADDEARPILHGVNFKPAAGAIVLASADNYRLQTSGVDSHWLAPDFDPFTVDASSLKIALAILRGADVIELHRQPTNHRGRMLLGLVAGDVRVLCRIIDGTYPNYEPVIPASFTVCSSFDVDDLTAAVQSIRTAAKEDADRVDVSINGALELRTAGASAVIPAVTSGMDDPYGLALVTLNVGYLANALTTMSGIGRIHWNGPMSPIMLTSDIDSYRAVIMPVRR
jgi:DNA polymerase-3 subunit beta